MARWWPGTRCESSTWRQEYWGHTYKAGWDSVINDKMFFEVRGGQFKYEWPNFRQTEELAYQDTGNNLVRGGNRDGWFNIPSRNQVLGSLSYFKEGWGGSHNFKVGGEWFRETFTYIRGADGKGYVPGDVLHILNNGAPLQVELFQTPSISENGVRTTGLFLQDTWQVNPRLTLNLGIRYDRYRTFLPEQEGPPVGRFNTTAVVVRGDRQPGDLQLAGATHRRRLRSHRSRKNRVEVQLRHVLVESRDGDR